MKKNLFGLLALGVLAFSCSKDADLGNVDLPIDKVEGYLSLQIGGTQTRTTGTPTEEGLPAESVIDGVTIVFANSTGQISAVKAPVISNGVTEPIKIAVGTHYIYALVNNAVTVSPGENIQRIINVNSVSEALSGYKDGKFFMTNQHHSSSDVAGVAVNITEANTLNSPATATIRVDRVSAKITDETNTPDITALVSNYSGVIDEVDVTGFVALNINKQFNLIQQWSLDNEHGSALTSEVLHTPVYATGTLVANQFYNNIGEYVTLDKDGDGNIKSIIDKTESTPGLYTKTPVYVTENRPTMQFYGSSSQPTAGRGETTGVIYRVQAMKGGANSPTFYAYNGIAYADLSVIDALPDFQGQDLTTLPVDELRAKGVKAYVNGVMYYSYFILDPNISYQYSGNNYYGVFRNSVYKLAINKFSGLGDDVPGGGTVDPTEPGEPGNPPIDTDEAYITVTVKVNPWVLNTIGIDF